jgi:hypothetical protein
MTQAIRSRHPSRLLSRLAGWAARTLERLSDRIHAGGEAIARQQGWEITRTTGRLGLGTRTYHDPRFTHRSIGTGHSDPGVDTPAAGSVTKPCRQRHRSATAPLRRV